MNNLDSNPRGASDTGNKRLTQIDLARELGVSQATICRVLTNPAAVSEKLRERVQRALGEADYTPNQMARSLVSRSSQTIGVLLTATTVPSHMIRLVALTARLMEEGFLVLNALSDGREASEQRALDQFRGRMVDGLVSIHRPHMPDHNLVKHFRGEGKPIVVLSSEEIKGVDTVAHDIAGGIMQIVDHLVSLGHHKLGLLMMASGSPEMIERELGFREAMRGHGLMVPQAWVVREKSRAAARAWPPLPDNDLRVTDPESDYDIGYRAAKKLLVSDDCPTAAVCASDRMAVGAMRAFREAGMSIPDDIAVTGFDNLDESRFTTPALTTHECDDALLGIKAAELILDRLRHGDSGHEPCRVNLMGHLVPRGSTVKRT